MSRTLREQALEIWRAAVQAVDAERLVRESIRVADGRLRVGSFDRPLAEIGRIVVVGTGKAGAGMATGVEAALGEQLATEKRLTGWLNVPADCLRPLRWITLHAARPAGVNEPTEAGVVGAERILELVASLGPDDLCLCLISGGGSALLPAPVEGVSLEDKQRVTRMLSAAGANIEQLNTVRKQLSRIKGGRLAQACRAGRLVSLVISDVLGDPLDVIASGPTVPDSATAVDALRVLDTFGGITGGVPTRVYEQIAAFATNARSQSARQLEVSQPGHRFQTESGCLVENWVIGNNAVAVEAAATAARGLGYQVQARSSTTLEGLADDLGRELAREAMRMRASGERTCLITGGEPVVRLAPAEQRGRGGRNQQLVLAALAELWTQAGDRAVTSDPFDGLVILSGGTDGEDGPTDAAGALADHEVSTTARSQSLDPHPYLASNDAYRFFERVEGLIKTGPTHTNVCDVRVVLKCEE